MTLGEKQRLFTRLSAHLVLKAYGLGYECTWGEAWRSPETAAAYAADGRGIANSLHISRLAVDINLFRDGVYLTDSDDYQPLGLWWESLHPLCRWGGRFQKPDGNHFSLSHEGRA
jgi:hypothetical protein